MKTNAASKSVLCRRRHRHRHRRGSHRFRHIHILSYEMKKRK